jgi:hypothetical protein
MVAIFGVKSRQFVSFGVYPCRPSQGPVGAMVGVISLFSLLSGAALACAAERHPNRVALLERSAGVLMVGGLVLLGSTLPCIP